MVDFTLKELEDKNEGKEQNDYMLNKAWRKFTIFDRIQVINEKTDFGDDAFFVMDTKWIDWSTQIKNYI